MTTQLPRNPGDPGWGARSLHSPGSHSSLGWLSELSSPMCQSSNSDSNEPVGFSRFRQENEFTFVEGGSREYLFEVEQGRQYQVFLIAARAIVAKSYVVTARCLSTEFEYQEQHLLAWPISATLACPYVYLPQAAAKADLKLKAFRVPEGTSWVALRILAWPLHSPLPAPCGDPPMLLVAVAEGQEGPLKLEPVSFHSLCRDV